MKLPDIAKPSNPAPISEADIYAACKAFVATYALPALDAEHIIQGWQNRASLPPGSNDYAVVSILFDTQHGTAIETLAALGDPEPTAPGVLTVKGLVEVQVQIDFCAEDDSARRRARRLAIVTRSSIGVQFFNDYRLSALYADDVRDLSFVGDAQQFVRRYATTLHLTYWSGVSADFDYFTQAEVSRLGDLSASHS